MNIRSTALLLLGVGVILLFPSISHAHRSGCHNLHTCPSDTNSYICGDLGYPCDGSTSINNINPAAIHVPLLVEKTFEEIFGRIPTDTESNYWKKRFRGQKDSVYKIRRTMMWHKEHNSFGPPKALQQQENLVQGMNALFRSVYDGRNPSMSEHAYWLSRIADKPTQAALRGAMAYHKLHSIQH